MNITLSSIKYSSFASHETACFSAVVLVDGFKAGTVENSGQGGSNDYHPHTLRDALDAHGATLPAYIFDASHADGTIPVDADIFVNSLLDDFLAARDLKRGLSKRMMQIRDGAVYQTRTMPAATLAALVAKTPDALNNLPFSDALALYRAAA